MLGRAREGVVWRFRSDLDESLVLEIARLAAREQGFPIDGKTKRPPDRLAAIEKKLISGDAVAPSEGGAPHRETAAAPLGRDLGAGPVRHTWVSSRQGVVGELWAID
ncbi:MAG: hypothetical protein AAGC67_15770 [Myxococcota bacterium]